jgi:hypothetical protein
MNDYYKKYLKYKIKYIQLKKLIGGYIYNGSENRLFELIYPKDETRTDTLLKVYFMENLSEATEELSKLSANIRLDMGDVLDILPDDYSIFDGEKRENNKICSLSWVGIKSTGKPPEEGSSASDRVDTIFKTRESIKKRILSGQIDFGIILFERGDKNEKSFLTTIKPGSKAWLNKNLNNFKATDSGKKAFFIDDSIDHIVSLTEIMVDVPVSEQVIGILKDTKLDIYKKHKIGPKDKAAIARNSEVLEREIKESFLNTIYEYSN